jgi:hypothetical protein
VALLTQVGLETLEPCLLVRQGAAVLLEGTLLGGGGTDHCRPPAPRGWPPGGPALRADSLAQQDGLQPVLGGLERPARLRPGAAAVADRRGLDGRGIDLRQIARAPEPGQLGRSAALGVDAVAGLRRAQSGGDAAAEQWLLRAIAIKPGPAGARFVAKDQRFRVRGERAAELVNGALAGPETPPEDDRCRPWLADRGAGEGVVVNR